MNKLNWRKYPNEKPEPSDDDIKIVVFDKKTGKRWISDDRYINGYCFDIEFTDKESRFEVTHWAIDEMLLPDEEL